MSVVLLRRFLECEWWRTLEWGQLCVWDACSEANWRESFSIRSSSPAVLSVVNGEMFAVVGGE